MRDIIEEFIRVRDDLSPGPVPTRLPTLSAAKLPEPTLFSRVRFWQAAQMKWSGLATQLAWCWRPQTQQPEARKQRKKDVRVGSRAFPDEGMGGLTGVLDGRLPLGGVGLALLEHHAVAFAAEADAALGTHLTLFPVSKKC